MHYARLHSSVTNARQAHQTLSWREGWCTAMYETVAIVLGAEHSYHYCCM